MNIDALARTLVSVVDKKAAGRQLELPPLPWHKPALLALLQGRFELKAVAPILDRDPILALECLRHAQRGPIVQDTHGLLNAVGTANMRQLVAAVSRRRYHESRDPEVREIFGRVCGHAAVVAEICRNVAVHVGISMPDHATFGALLTSVGAPIVAFHLLDLERASQRAHGRGGLPGAAFLELLQRVSGEIAKVALLPYRLPGFVQEVLDEPDEYESAHRKSVANCVRFGRHVTVRAGMGIGEQNRDQLMAALMIGRSVLELREDAVGHLLESAEAAIHSLPPWP